jgi:Domain of unknown function (DUF4189)
MLFKSWPLISKSAFLTAVLLASLEFMPSARGQGYVAAIAYSQSTGKIGYTAREASTEQHAKALALQSCGAADAKVWMWAQNEWVAIAVSDDNLGTAGFAHSPSADAAQQLALRQCRRLAKGGACTVKLCIHSSGMRPRTLLTIPRDPSLPPLPPKKPSEFFAAIAYSPSTGKIGYTASRARTKEDAQARAVKNCGAPDARAFMWGNEWVAIAISENRPGVAGFGPGATREVAERHALQQCKKLTHGGPCRIALAVHSSGKNSLPPVAKAKPAPAPEEQVGPSKDPAVIPAAAETQPPEAEESPASPGESAQSADQEDADDATASDSSNKSR